MPKLYNNYHEPFLGGGALFFALQPPHGLLSDRNAELVNFYRMLTTEPEALLAALREHEISPGYYKRLRALSPVTLSPVEQASRFLYLNRTSFNGLYRVNKRGEYNVPFGVNPKVYEDPKRSWYERMRAADLLACSRALQPIELRAEDFDRALDRTQRGDFVYCDPPYDKLKSDSFTSYDANGFDWLGHLVLAAKLDQLTQREVYWMLSNSPTPRVRERYRHYVITEVEAPRAINSDGNGRGKVKELLISNYHPGTGEFYCG